MRSLWNRNEKQIHRGGAEGAEGIQELEFLSSALSAPLRKIMRFQMQADTNIRWTRKHLLGLEELSAEEIRFVLDTADSFKEVSTRSIKKVPALRGRVVVNAFFEDSTRTRVSFALASQRLSADLSDFSEKTSSTNKGETLIDTARNIEAMGIDILVIRHAAAGSAHVL